MRITTKIVFDIDGNVLEHEFYEYDGPLALADRAAQSQASQAAKTAGGTAAQYGSDASSIGSQLVPFLTREMTNPQGMSQQDLGAQLTAGMAGSGGANSGITGQANLQVARTGNTGGFQAALDNAARMRQQTSAKTSEGIAADNAQLKQKQQQQGAAGLQGLYGTDVGAQFKGLDAQNADIDAEIKAGQSGWLQNGLDIANTVLGKRK